MLMQAHLVPIELVGAVDLRAVPHIDEVILVEQAGARREQARVLDQRLRHLGAPLDVAAEDDAVVGPAVVAALELEGGAQLHGEELLVEGELLQVEV